MNLHKRIIAHHLILSSYGFWLANDPRGSGSTEMLEKKFQDLGPIHHGRKKVQPTREDLRVFYSKALPRLEHAPLWFDAAARKFIAEAFKNVITRCGYTVWACFVGSNHAHLCVRYHRDSYEKIWINLAGQSRTTLASQNMVPEMHPVWADRPYSVYLHTPDDVRRTIAYIDDNAEKEGLVRQSWPFVRIYDGWPMNKIART